MLRFWQLLHVGLSSSHRTRLALGKAERKHNVEHGHASCNEEPWLLSGPRSDHVRTVDTLHEREHSGRRQSDSPAAQATCPGSRRPSPCSRRLCRSTVLATGAGGLAGGLLVCARRCGHGERLSPQRQRLFLPFPNAGVRRETAKRPGTRPRMVEEEQGPSQWAVEVDRGAERLLNRNVS